MSRTSSQRSLFLALSLGALSLAPSQAFALQPLTVFLQGAKTANFDAREQAATVEQRYWEASAALGRLLPSVSARGVLQYNQYESVAKLPSASGTPVSIVITPQFQKDAFFQFDLPLIDVASYHRYEQAKHLERASDLQRAAVDFQVVSTVTRSYFVYVGASALTKAAEKSLRSAEDNLNFVKNRAEFGAATELDVARANANVERARQDVADADLSRKLTARNLETLTGIQPSPVEATSFQSLDPESPLSDWMSNTDTPADKVQRELLAATASGRKAARAALLPTLSANAQERLTNATGFTGHGSIYTLQAILSWRFDWNTYANARAQRVAESVQDIRTEKTRRASADAIYEAYQRVETGIVKSRSARAQAEAANKAAEFADQRYRAGAATQLDVTQAQRDAFLANVSMVQADADLAYARVQLRAVSGKPIH
jgi:outer membrane protein TolC